MAEARRRTTSPHFLFFGWGWSQQDRGSRSTSKHTAAAQTHVLHVCADVACSWCSCSAGSTRVLGVAVLRPHRISAPHLALSPVVRKALSSHHNSQRLQALEVLLRSGAIGLGLTFLARLMVVLRAESGFFGGCIGKERRTREAEQDLSKF